MGKIVEFCGPKDARIFIVGEAPGANEEIDGVPFVGGAGRLLNRLLSESGITRTECRLGNVMRVRPPANDFAAFYLDKAEKVRSPELVDGIAYLKEEIGKTKPNLVVALGNEPLRALTEESGITNWRGSILYPPTLLCKLIPTFHPANLLRAWGNVPLVMMDFRRIREEMRSPAYVPPIHNFLLSPTLAQIIERCEWFRQTKSTLAFDVETDEDMQITAIAFAWSAVEAISIPITRATGVAYWTVEDELVMWETVKSVLEDEGVPKMAQNAQFDIIMFMCSLLKIRPKGLVLDTMVGFHTVYPEIAASEKEGTTGTVKHKVGGGKKLALLCSIYTRQPYYKHWIHSGDEKKFWTYNCMDAAVTYECGQAILKEMVEFKVYNFYYVYVNPLINVLINVQLRGVLIDEEVRATALREYTEETIRLQTLLNGAVEYDVNVMSPAQLKHLLYVDLGLPPVFKRSRKEEDVGKTTTNEDALLSLAKKFNSPFFDLIIAIRGNRRVIGTYLEGNVGKDGRMHCSYVLGATDTGRLASRESIFNSGTNLQNIPHGVCRRMFVADPGKVFVAGDLSQAEARIVAYLANETAMIEVFESGGDIHQLSAEALPPGFVPKGSSYEGIDNPRRLFAKKHNHAFNYGEGPVTFARRADIDSKTAESIRNGYFYRFPYIKLWHLQIQAELSKGRTLTSPLGRRRTFFGMWGDELFRSAYAFKPQATIADINNLATIRLQEREIMLTTHDELVLQCEPEKVKETIEAMRKAYDIPVPINGKMVKIPVEFKVGLNWEDLKKWVE